MKLLPDKNSVFLKQAEAALKTGKRILKLSKNIGGKI